MALKTSQFPPVLITDRSVTILAGQVVSDAVDMLGTVLVAILTKDALAIATSVSFLVSVDGVDFFPAFNDASVPLAIAVQPNRHIAMEITDFASIRFMKLVTDTIEASDVTFTLIARPAL